MGNKLGRRRQVVDEKYTRPQGLYHHKDVDNKKLRRLILDSKLAPCYPGEDECAAQSELEECPICFLYYPSLNRSRCCMKGICTECFLQMKTPNSTLPTQCPFCKTINYAVEYRGGKTKEEKGMEKIEEQLVIEAKIRMRQQELQDEEERILKQKEMCSSSNTSGPSVAEHCSTEVPLAASVEGSEVVTSQQTCSTPAIRQPVLPRQIREDEFDLDLEDIMVMEAIWLSIQENGKLQAPCHSAERVPIMVPPVGRGSSPSSPSPSGGLACAIAALAERQQTERESSSSSSSTFTSTTTASTYGGAAIASSSYPHFTSTRFPNTAMQVNEDYCPPHSEMSEVRNWADNGSSLMDEAGPPFSVPPIVPESFEEQMMLAMAVSLADSQSMTTTTSKHGVPGEAWR
ncbi:unnamed protein product [Cuscuta campestris]|uniref:RING-type domain-containing protein n=1 Tax=Cuscuta campestris TaxID=132261 RepID=A0A484KIK1_9ASTE|nr:unnamed protein product [Cuscuta campestris]